MKPAITDPLDLEEDLSEVNPADSQTVMDQEELADSQVNQEEVNLVDFQIMMDQEDHSIGLIGMKRQGKDIFHTNAPKPIETKTFKYYLNYNYF